MIKYHLANGIKILFVGINPSPGTYERGIPFSNNKMFWYLLHDAGLIHESRDELQNDKKLKEIYNKKFTEKYHLGLINLINRPTRTISELKRSEAFPGRKRIIIAIQKYKPKIVCFIGKMTYQMFISKSTFDYGWQPDIYESKIYVMHTPLHGSAEVRIRELRELARIADK